MMGKRVSGAKPPARAGGLVIPTRGVLRLYRCVLPAYYIPAHMKNGHESRV